MFAATRSERRRDNTAAIRRAFIDAGRRLFGMQGYDATSLAQICTAANATTGSLYHHFGDKAALLAAVVESIDRETVQNTLAMFAEAAKSDPWNAVLVTVDWAVERGLDPGIRRIYKVDGPGVLGLQRWTELRERTTLSMLTDVIRQLQAAGILVEGDPRRLSRIVDGVVTCAICTFPDDETSARDALPEVQRIVRTMLQALRAPAVN